MEQTLGSGREEGWVMALSGLLVTDFTCDLFAASSARKYPASSDHSLPDSPRGFQGLGFMD